MDAAIENVTAVTGFMDEQLERLGCPLESQAQIDAAIDSICSKFLFLFLEKGVVFHG